MIAARGPAEMTSVCRKDLHSAVEKKRETPEEIIMATKANFTPDEWKSLLQSPLLVGIAVSAADPSGTHRHAQGEHGERAGAC